MSVNNVRVPPDSTGKRIHIKHNMEVDYVSGTIPFQIGDIVTGATSGVIGTVVKVEGTTATGEVYLVHNHDTPDVWSSGERIYKLME